MRIISVLQLYLLIFTFVFSMYSYSAERKDPLPSWNDVIIKKNIIDFVQAVTDKTNDNFVPPQDRIATIDNDGTLWVEQPIYPQVIFMINRLKVIAKKHPEWKNKEPFKSILTDNYKKLTGENIDRLFAETSSGMNVEEYKQIVNEWLKIAKNPRYKHPYNELVYQPMLEVMDYLRENDFKVYIVSGGGQDFIRAFAHETYGVPSEHVVGTTTTTQYFNNNGATLIKSPNLLFVSDKAGKVEAINLFIGKKPIIAFGNSDGDRQMLEWTQSGKGKRLMLLIHHDDAEREYAYDTVSKVGNFPASLMDKAKKNNWQVISMRYDWKVMFPFEVSHHD